MQNRISNLFPKWALAIAILVGCSRSVGGSESNFVSCKDDTDCSAGTCVAGTCKTRADSGVGNGGAGGARAAGSCAGCTKDSGPNDDAGPPTSHGGGGGRQGNGGGCSAAGAYTQIVGGAAGDTSGFAGAPGAPTCPVDSDGVATVDQPTFCGMYRCPKAEADLLTGLTCTEMTTDHDGVTITTGCGVQTVTVTGPAGFIYAAHFSPGSDGPVALDARQTRPFGVCNAAGYRLGQEPATCASDITYKCRGTDPVGSGFIGCRSPGEPGCATCCTQNGAFCAMSSAQPGSVEYDVTGGQPGPCPCNCSACASCTPDLERHLITEPSAELCDCATVPVPEPNAGGGPSYGGAGSADFCVGWCVYARPCGKIR